MDRERLADYCDRGILALVLSILVFGPLATGAVRTLEFLIIQALTLGVACLWIARIWITPNYKLLWPPVCWALLAFIIYAIVRYQQATLEYVAREELIRILVYAFLFMVILNQLHRQEFIPIVVYSLLFVAMGISMYAGYQLITGSDKVWHFIRPDQYDKRGSGTYICPNHLAGFLEMVLPLGMAYVLTSRIGHVARILVGYATLAALAGIGFSISRGGWLATGVALMVFFLLLLRQRDYRLPAIICLAILIGGGFLFISKTEHSRERFREMFVAGKLENVRFRLWKPAVQIWKESPWLGVGPAHFDYRFRVYRPPDVQMRPNRVHNDYLNTLTDWGIVGFTIVAIGWGLLGWSAHRAWKYTQRSNDLVTRRSNRFALVLGASTGLIALLLHSCVDFNLHIPANAILAVCLAALLASHIRFATERFWFRAGFLLRLCLSIAVLAGAFYLGQQGWRRWNEYRPLDQARLTEEKVQRLQKQLAKADRWSTNYTVIAQQIRELEPAFIQSLRDAHAADPNNFETTYRLGEAIRTIAWQGNTDYRERAEEAMTWFEKGMRLNPWDGYNYLRYGMCLVRLRRTDEAKLYFDKALALDPNGYFTIAHMGWYHIERGSLLEAKDWFEHSLRLKPHVSPDDNPVAFNYLRIIERRIAEGQTRA